MHCSCTTKRGETHKSFNFDKHNYARYVVNVALLAAPALVRGAHQCFSRALGILGRKEREDDRGDLLVFKELPDAVTRDYEDLVLRVQVELLDLGHGVHASPAGHRVAEGTGHRQPRRVFMLEPDSHGADLVAKLVPVRVNSSVVGQNDFRLLRIVRFVVPRDGCDIELVTVI